MTPRKTLHALIQSYDRIASRYAEEFFDELARKPFDRELLDRFAGGIRDEGPVVDVGCGPGQVTRYLHDRGLRVTGIDLSERMLACARERSPGVPFEVGDLRALDRDAESLAGLVGFYAIIHLGREEVQRALAEMHRVLGRGGALLLSFHGGEGTAHADEWFGEPVIMDATFFSGEEMAGHARAAGFEDPEVAARDPLPFEFPVPRVFLLARKS